MKNHGKEVVCLESDFDSDFDSDFSRLITIIMKWNNGGRKNESKWKNKKIITR